VGDSEHADAIEGDGCGATGGDLREVLEGLDPRSDVRVDTGARDERSMKE